MISLNDAKFRISSSSNSRWQRRSGLPCQLAKKSDELNSKKEGNTNSRREALESKPGWGFNILKNHERRMSCSSNREDEQVFTELRGSFVDLLRTSSLREVNLKSNSPNDHESRTSSGSSTTTTGTLSSVGFTESSNSQAEQRASSSATSSESSSRPSISSSQGSSENAEGLFRGEVVVQNSPGRVVYRRGLSQRRIRSGKQPDTQFSGSWTELPSSSSSKKEFTASKEDRFLLAVKKNDEAAVVALYQEGVSLECVDKFGMTPLIVACLDAQLESMVLTLLRLGSSVNAYRSGVHAGYPLHHAAERGHHKIVSTLLSYGAQALAVNDDGQTALDIARIRGHASVVRVIEDWICLFKGIVRQTTDNAGLQIMKRVWAVVLPTDTNPQGVSKHELVVYNSRKVPMPESVILLGNFTSEFGEPDFESPDPSLLVSDRVTRTKFKFYGQESGDKEQLAALYRACKGIPSHKQKQQQQQQALVPDLRNTQSVDRDKRPAMVVPRSWSEKPASKKNSIFPEESLPGKCGICNQSFADAMSIPCGHFSGCASCLSDAKTDRKGCPVCQAPIHYVLKPSRSSTKLPEQAI